MDAMSLAKAKAHISELVDGAEHHGRRTIILRHGKPAAAIVPVKVARPASARVKPKPTAEVIKSVQEFVDAFSSTEPRVSAVADLLIGRR
jgi:prevent-host-death family protein